MTAIQEDDSERRLRRVVRMCGGLLLLQSVIGIAVPAGLGWDFANFYDAGRRVAAGQVEDLFDARREIAGQPPQGHLDFLSTPISAALYAPLSAFSPETALVVFKIENTLALFAALSILLVFYGRFAGNRPEARVRFTALFLFLALIFQPLWTVYRVGGQTTPTVLLLLCAGLVWHVRGRLHLSSLAFVIAVLIKPALATGLLLLTLISGLRFAAITAANLAAAIVLSLATMGLDIHLRFLEEMLSKASATYPWTFNSSLHVWIGQMLTLANERTAPALSPGILRALSLALQLFVVAVFAALVRASRATAWIAPARRHFEYTIAVLFFLLVSRTIWESYLSLLFPFLVYVVATRASFSPAVRRLVAVLFVFAVGQNLIVALFLRDTFAFDSALSLSAISLFKSAPLLITLVLLIRHWRELFTSHAQPAWELHEG